MNVESATKIILRPYITEKTYALVENEQKICFLVEREASKPQIVDAIRTLYNEDVLNVDTARTIYGKKAFVQFTSPEPSCELGCLRRFSDRR